MAHGPLAKVVELELSFEESEAGTLGNEGGELNPTETMKMRRTARRGMMEREEFVGRVRVQLGAKSEEEAVRTVEAYLETLAERLGGFGPYDLSEKLPWLEAYPAEGTGEANHFPRREFRRRVGERAGVSEAEAVRRARLVGEVLSRAAGPDAIDDLRGQLPEEFWELLGRRR